MNVERMQRLADEIENPTMAVGFGMAYFVTTANGPIAGPLVEQARECGTAFCIGGLACLLFGGPSTHVDSSDASELLGLDRDQSGKLFFNDHDYIAGDLGYFGDITREQAAAAIRRMIAEGDGGDQ